MNVGSTLPGAPYIAKWPDPCGNLKSREVLRPGIISEYFSKSNIIDVGNGIRQNELAFERHWLTKNPWFRIDCTSVGITVADSYLAAQKQAPDHARIKEMGARNFSMHLVHDLWTRKVSMEPKSNIVAARTTTGPSAATSSTNTSYTDKGIGVQLTPPSLEAVMMEHQIGFTTTRSGKGKNGKGQLARRACQMGAVGCQGICTTECHHRVCKRKQNPSVNRHGSNSGTFICGNMACRMKHYTDAMNM